MQWILALFKHKYVKLIIVCNIYVPFFHEYDTEYV